jgi:hypothetical protein
MRIRSKSINNDIGALVKRGLPLQIQQAVDVLRVVGNNAVHPGELDLKDDSGTAVSLFNLMNVVVETMISQPKHIQQLFDGLPTGAKDAIAKRDNQS